MDDDLDFLLKAIAFFVFLPSSVLYLVGRWLVRKRKRLTAESSSGARA